jgi:hypothetical protein
MVKLDPIFRNDKCTEDDDKRIRDDNEVDHHLYPEDYCDTDIQLWHTTNRIVKCIFDSSENICGINCTCGYDVTMGLLCRHVHAVIAQQPEVRTKVENNILNYIDNFWMLSENECCTSSGTTNRDEHISDPPAVEVSNPRATSKKTSKKRKQKQKLGAVSGTT